ncbi:hypothetical protein CEXT_757681 [Caerostris extrusa]|uniref:Uncharacterized protein n=1 Tax=Caerostris extrusa TaxID=172846 RepID=A0AAV4YF84_CAEEX|nr:hypothetical protein CEXT_757681 [Caerostris extrusa]
MNNVWAEKNSINKPRSSSASCVMHAKRRDPFDDLQGSEGHYQSQTVPKTQRSDQPFGNRNIKYIMLYELWARRRLVRNGLIYTQMSILKESSFKNLMLCGENPVASRAKVNAFGKSEIFPSSAGTTLFERAIVAEAEISQQHWRGNDGCTLEGGNFLQLATVKSSAGIARSRNEGGTYRCF